MTDLLSYEFIRNALIAAVLVNIACGIVGTYVVIKRIVFISGGISHAAFGGIGLGYYAGIDPVMTAIPFTLFSAMAMGILSKKAKINEDAAIGIFWAAGMALGILFLNLAPGYAPDLFSYLFGNILTVPVYELYIMGALDLIIIITVAIFHREFSSISFDEEFSLAIGIPVRMIYLVMLGMVALSVVVMIRVVGVILIIALLTIPATICRQFTFKIRNLIACSIATGIVFTIGGLIISYFADLAPGATIILLLTAALGISYFVKKIKIILWKYM
ncbi:MAG: metal ABC transporter permease [Actinobacteria bacterium]|nr:metal ABC transporter permease [Actinomycetota bacterium]